MNPGKLIGGGGSGTILSLAIVYLGSRLGWHLTAEDGGAAVATATAIGAFVAHYGIVGIVRIVLHGETTVRTPVKAGVVIPSATFSSATASTPPSVPPAA